MDRTKQMAVAMAAVSAYIKAEEEEAMTASTRDSRSPAWSMSGRLTQTQQRNMVQTIAFR
jgi:hypothetical protein